MSSVETRARLRHPEKCQAWARDQATPATRLSLLVTFRQSDHCMNGGAWSSARPRALSCPLAWPGSLAECGGDRPRRYGLGNTGMAVVDLCRAAESACPSHKTDAYYDCEAGTERTRERDEVPAWPSVPSCQPWAESWALFGVFVQPASASGVRHMQMLTCAEREEKNPMVQMHISRQQILNCGDTSHVEPLPCSREGAADRDAPGVRLASSLRAAGRGRGGRARERRHWRDCKRGDDGLV